MGEHLASAALSAGVCRCHFHGAELPQMELPTIGMKGGLFNATTGYSIVDAVRTADSLATMISSRPAAAWSADIKALQQQHWRNQRFFRRLNSMLFFAIEPQSRWRILDNFYGKSETVIRGLYAGRMAVSQRVALLASFPPPVPVGKGLQYFFGKRAALTSGFALGCR